MLSEYGITPGEHTAPDDQATAVSEELIRRLISPRSWKHAVTLISMACLCLATALFITSLDGEQLARQRIGDGVVGTLLLLSGQLAILIGWIRCRSEVDFQGRYRIWKWAAVLLIGCGVIQTTGTAELVTSLLLMPLQLAVGPVTAARPAILLMVLSTAAALTAWRLLPDMGRCRSSQLFQTFALALIGFRLILVVPSLAMRFSHATASVVELSIGFSLFASNLLHTRFVLYVNNDPPVSRRRSENQSSDEITEGIVGRPVPQTTASDDAKTSDVRSGDVTNTAAILTDEVDLSTDAEEPEDALADGEEQSAEELPPAKRTPKKKSARQRRKAA
ncbi:MAG: hypothetical protein KDA96_13410 [Planctomycetaceae bacterium]|nr:hypothetical protein [Planctomycetaceae bacterium]